MIKISSHTKIIDSLWGLLVALTLLSAYMAERADASFISVSIMAIVLAIKGRIIVDHFMELKNANKILRRLMRLYFYVIPTLIIIVHLFPNEIASWTTL